MSDDWAPWLRLPDGSEVATLPAARLLAAAGCQYDPNSGSIFSPELPSPPDPISELNALVQDRDNFAEDLLLFFLPRRPAGGPPLPFDQVCVESMDNEGPEDSGYEWTDSIQYAASSGMLAAFGRAVADERSRKQVVEALRLSKARVDAEDDAAAAAEDSDDDDSDDDDDGESVMTCPKCGRESWLSCPKCKPAET